MYIILLIKKKYIYKYKNYYIKTKIYDFHNMFIYNKYLY